MASDSTPGTATLIWTDWDNSRLKLKKADETVALNRGYECTEARPLLPDDLKLFDTEDDEIENASFVDIQQRFSIQYEGCRYHFNEAVKKRPPEQRQQQQVGKLFVFLFPFVFIPLFEYGNVSFFL